MRGSMSLILGLTTLLLGSAPAPAATYYVAKGGSDNRTCAQAQHPVGARQTINAGITCLQGSDTLVIGGGIYDEILSNGRTAVTQPIPNGTAAQHTVIRAVPGERVTLRPLSVSYPGGGGAVTTVANARYLTFDGINVDAAQQHTYGVSLDGAHIEYRQAEIMDARSNGVASFRGDAIAMRHLHVHHNGLRETGYPKPHGFYVCGTNKLIEHSFVHDNANYGIQVSCEQGGIRHAIVRYNLVLNNPSRGIQVQGHNNVVHSNVLVQNGIGIGIGGGSGVKVYNNTIYGFSPLPDNYGMLIGGGNVEIANNLILQQVQRRMGGSSRYLYFEGTSPRFAGNLCDAPMPGCQVVEPDSAKIVRNAAGGDFHLTAGSPGIDAGVVLREPALPVFAPLVSVDMDGNQRPIQSTTDIGAYEFGGAARPVPVVPLVPVPPPTVAVPPPAPPTPTPTTPGNPRGGPVAVPTAPPAPPRVLA